MAIVEKDKKLSLTSTNASGSVEQSASEVTTCASVDGGSGSVSPTPNPLHEASISERDQIESVQQVQLEEAHFSFEELHRRNSAAVAPQVDLTAHDLLELVFDRGSDVPREEGDLSVPANAEEAFRSGVRLTPSMLDTLMFAKVKQKRDSDA